MSNLGLRDGDGDEGYAKGVTGIDGDFSGMGGAVLGVGLLGGRGIGFGDGAGPKIFGDGAITPQSPTEALIEQNFGRPAVMGKRRGGHGGNRGRKEAMDRAGRSSIDSIGW